MPCVPRPAPLEMKSIRETRHGIRPALVALVAALALLAVGAQSASAAPAATQRATSQCWRAVINDWLDNNRVDHTYPVACYTQAIQHLNAYPDVQQYSSAADDIHRALLALLHGGGGQGPGSQAGGGGSSSGGGGGGSSLGSGGTSAASNGANGSNGSSPITTLIGRPSDAQSIPLPVIVLGVLALLLLLAGGGTWLLRRMQMRRMTPATEPASAPQPRP